MQPKFTLRILAGFRMRVFAIALILLSATTLSHSQALINQNFDVANPLPTGWAQQNLSNPLGAGIWTQGNPANFTSNSGAPNSYATVLFNSGSGTATVSNWLLTPTVTIVNGSTLSFFTRTVTGNTFPDRLQVRMSTAGASANVGATATSVGDFSTLLQDINPTYTNAYPEVWTKITINVTGVPVATTGRFAFRYFVENGGTTGANSNVIGLDDVLYTGPCVPTNATAPVISSVPSSTCAGSPITLSILSGSLNGAADWKWYTTACGSGASIGTGSSITVSPVSTTTYYARGEDGCAPAPGPCGSQTVTVTACSCITPDVSTICAGSVQALRVNQTLPATLSAPFANTGAITISAGAGGPGTPYPSTIAVAGLPGGATINSVSINGLTHTFPEDLDIILRSPSGQMVILMSDIGGFAGTTNANLVFNDASPAMSGAVVSGTFRPTNLAGTFGVEPDNWPAPGPGTVTQASPTLASISAAGNGTWELFVVDDFNGDGGTISGGWSITFNIPATTATWSPVTGLFTNPNGTGAYVAGTQTAVVYASPAATATYTATVNNGPCAGANTVTVNVLPVSAVSVTPNGLPDGVCAQTTLVATGASIYNWSPATGLNTTTGASVVATPSSNTTYTVNGYAANGCPTAPVSVLVKGTSTSAVISSLGAPPTIFYNEGFEVVAPLPSGWAAQNNSTPGGSTSWFQGNATVFPAQSGTPTSYIGANFNNTTFAAPGTISNWLFAPVGTISNGDQLTFYARSANAIRPDRLQVRMSSNGGSVNVGGTPTSTGDFSTLLLDINPTYNLTTGFPNEWVLYTVTVSGLSAPVSGRFALRYFVENAGDISQPNSNFIGIDNVTHLKPSLATCANTLSNIKVDITGGSSPYTVVYTNGTTNFIVPSYTSGSLIQVSPAATTTYTLVSVTGSNGCAGIGNTGSAVITVTPPPSITTQPANRTTCVGLSTSFTVTAGPSLGTTYQWQVSTNGGGSYSNVTNVAPYSGATTATLTITNATVGLNQNRYRVIVTGVCPAPSSSVTSAAATLFVNEAPSIVTQPANTTRCLGTTATFTVVASTPNGPATPTYQWQVSTNNGLSYTNITGATAATLTLTGVTLLQNNNLYRVIVTTAPCAATITSTGARLNVNDLPVITIATPTTQLTPGLTTVITATNTPAALTPASYSWTLNGATVTGATAATIPVDIDKLGTYRATVTDINGCVASSNTITIDAQASDRLWIYPNPTNGAFQVRMYYGSNEADSRVVTVYNSQGQEVAKKSLDFRRGVSPYAQVSFDLSNLPAGTYVVKLTQKNTQKVVGGLLLIL